jgi:hypothetical protein
MDIMYKKGLFVSNGQERVVAVIKKKRKRWKKTAPITRYNGG